MHLAIINIIFIKRARRRAVLDSRTLGSVVMGGHVGVASPTQLPVARSARWHALAPEAARPARSEAHVRPGVPTAPHPTQPRAVYLPDHTQNSKEITIPIN